MAKEIILYKTKAQQVEVKRKIPDGIKKYVANVYKRSNQPDYKSMFDGRA